MNNPRTQIMTLALKRFMRFGIRSVSMDDLARELGISKKTLYTHFADKKALVLACVSQHFKQEETDCMITLQQNENPVGQMLDLAKRIAEHLGELNPATIYDIRKYYPESWKIFKNHREEFIVNRIRENIELGQNTGSYRAEINAPLAALFYIELVESTLTRIVAASKLHPLQVVTSLMDYHLHALLSEKGIKELEEYRKNNEQNDN